MAEVLFTVLQTKSFWELVAVVLSLVYIALATRENNWCWPAAFVSTAIYTALFWQVSLLMDSALNVYYMAMAIYGWRTWNKAAEQRADTPHHITRWSWKSHSLAILGIAALSALSGAFLQHKTTAAWPYIDSFTTWASVLTTYMVARKILENWLYWMVIDSAAILLYIERGLYPTAALFALYLVMCVVGFFTWKKRYRRATEGAINGVDIAATS